AFAVQSETPEGLLPYTRAIAHGEGWRWKIPLQHRTGNGLVYSSAHLSDDVARDRLLAGIDGKPLFEPRQIRFTSGMRRRVWNHNCLSLGLASGFVEPLESTSIHLVMIAVTWLVQNFPFGDDSAALAERFNARTRREWEQVRDFIILHYVLTERDDTPFWQSRRTLPIPDSLAGRIALFRESAMAYQDKDELFRIESWVEVMLGQGVSPRSHHRLPATMPTAQLQGAMNDLRNGIATAVERLPGYETFLARFRQPA
ncbi:MAG: tryptophan halogenase, partial [Lysobacteraceae bacterium]